MTLEQLRAQAMLLGMWYDYTDHTFNHNDNKGTPIDADTLEPVGYDFGNYDGEQERWRRVSDGEIGATDHAVPAIRS